MKLEPIIQSEVSQIVKDKCQILMCIYTEYRKIVLRILFVGQQRRQRIDFWT